MEENKNQLSTTTLKKYYIAQVLNPKTNQVVFLFAEINPQQKVTPKPFADFFQALKFFIDIASETKVASNVYFNKANKYEGFASLPQAKVIMVKAPTIKVPKDKVIDFLKQNNLITPLSVISIANDRTIAMSAQSFGMNDLAKNVKLTLLNTSLKLDEVLPSHIKGELPGYEVKIEKVLINDKRLEVFYFIKKGNVESSVYIKDMSGFGTDKIVVSSARTLYDDVQLKERKAAKEENKASTVQWIVLGFLIFMSFLNLLLYILLAIKAI